MLELLCQLPNGVIIKNTAFHEEAQKMVVATNVGVFTIDKDGTYDQITDSPPTSETFTFRGKVFNNG